MKKSTIALAAAFAALAACGRTEDGRATVERPGDVDVNVQTTKDTVTLPKVDMPDVDVGTTKDTMIVRRPTVDVKP